MSSLKPYQPPATLESPATSESSGRPQGWTWKQWVWLVAYCYPLALPGSFYFLWLLAWWELKRRPIPMLDDPKSIGGLVSAFYLLPVLMLMALPVLWPLGFVAGFMMPAAQPRGKLHERILFLLGLYFLLSVVVLLLMREDPGRVIEWYLD